MTAQGLFEFRVKPACRFGDYVHCGVLFLELNDGAVVDVDRVEIHDQCTTRTLLEIDFAFGKRVYEGDVKGLIGQYPAHMTTRFGVAIQHDNFLFYLKRHLAFYRSLNAVHTDGGSAMLFALDEWTRHFGALA